MSRWISLAWVALLVTLLVPLADAGVRLGFEDLTRNHPFAMGFLKIAVLGTMGELLGKRLALGAWRLRGIRLWQRAAVWGLLGVVFALVFPLFSFGAEGLLQHGLLPGAGSPVATALWKSLLMNTIFAFPMMVFHRVTDTLIDRGLLFSRWPLVGVVSGLDWSSLIRVVGSSCLWFWVPAHTLTFLLPPEYRVLSAALLSTALGLLLGVARKRGSVAVAPATSLAR